MSIVKVESWLRCLLPYTGRISYIRLRVFCCVCVGEAKEKVEGGGCRFVRRPACESGMIIELLFPSGLRGLVSAYPKGT